MDEQLNNSTGGGFSPNNASINQTSGILTSETNSPFHANPGRSLHVHPGPNYSSEMLYLGQPSSGSNPSLTPLGPPASNPSIYLGPVSDPSYTPHLSYLTGSSSYIPGGSVYPQFASSSDVGSFSWSIPEIGSSSYAPVSNVPIPHPYIVTDANAGLSLYGASNIGSGIGQQTSGFVGQSSQDASDNNNNTVPASYGGNAQLLGYGHVAASSEGSARFPSSRYSGSTSGGDLHTWQGDYLSARVRPTSDRPRSRAAAVNRRSIRDDERLIVTGRTSNFLPVDLSDFYGNIRPIYEQPHNLGVGAQTGVPEEIIANSLAEFMFFTSEQNKDEKTCPICLEDWKNMERMGRLKVCSHVFHVGCITEWLKIKSICPVCRSKAW